MQTWVWGGMVILALTILGWTLQMEGPRFNTTVKILDLVMNVLVCIIAFRVIVRGGPWAVGGGFFLYRSLNNILPLCRMMISNYTRETNLKTVQLMCCEARNDYIIQWERKRAGPCIYVANHALWCLDDIVALGAIARRELSIVINAGPSGLKMIPKDCREYMCVIQRNSKKRGEGYRVMKEIMESEVKVRGKSLIVFPENMNEKTSPREPARVRSGTVRLAMELGIPIVPIWIHWPCQFPTILNSCSKVLCVREGKPANVSSDKNLEGVRNEIETSWKRMSIT
jgi:hypothetical protein